VRRTRNSARTRDFTIGDDHESGTTPVWGRLFSTDALGALAAGTLRLSCQCGRSECPAIVDDGRASSIVVHVVVERGSTQATPDAQIHGQGSASERGQEAGRKKAALIPCCGIVPAPLLAELIGRGAKLKPVVVPKSEPEPRYQPSTALDEFVGTRDMTCRAVGCDRRAISADIDHTVPYPAGATHPGNLKCYCRIHRHEPYEEATAKRRHSPGTPFPTRFTSGCLVRRTARRGRRR
jgi:Domain of unknown function (DUF222)